MSAFLFGSWKARYLIWSIALAIGCLPLYEMTNGCNLIKLVDLQDISLLCVVVHWQPESESLHIRTCNPAITYESLNIFKSKFLYYLKRDLKLLSHVITNTAACGEFDGISTNLSICRIILSVSICNDDRFPMKMELLSSDWKSASIGVVGIVRIRVILYASGIIVFTVFTKLHVYSSLICLNYVLIRCRF